MELLVLAPVSFVDAACESLFMSETVDQRFIADPLGVLVPVTDAING